MKKQFIYLFLVALLAFNGHAHTGNNVLRTFEKEVIPEKLVNNQNANPIIVSSGVYGNKELIEIPALKKAYNVELLSNTLEETSVTLASAMLNPTLEIRYRTCLNKASNKYAKTAFPPTYGIYASILGECNPVGAIVNYTYTAYTSNMIDGARRRPAEIDAAVASFAKNSVNGCNEVAIAMWGRQYAKQVAISPNALNIFLSEAHNCRALHGK